MAKIRLTIDLDVGDALDLELEPDLKKGLNKREQAKLIRALITDNLGYVYVGYVTNKHAEDAVVWCAEGHIGSEHENEGARLIMEHHKLWSRIAKTASFKWRFI